MSYNIESVEIVGGGLSMTVNDFYFLREMEGLPEDCFLHDALGRNLKLSEVIPLLDLRWRGGWSGNSFNAFKSKVLTKTRGTAKLAVTWEDGEVTGLRVVDGVVRECAAKKVVE
jgi:hypothetical protein